MAHSECNNSEPGFMLVQIANCGQEGLISQGLGDEILSFDSESVRHGRDLERCYSPNLSLSEAFNTCPKYPSVHRCIILVPL